jgi:hypothetical protein
MRASLDRTLATPALMLGWFLRASAIALFNVKASPGVMSSALRTMGKMVKDSRRTTNICLMSNPFLTAPWPTAKPGPTCSSSEKALILSLLTAVSSWQIENASTILSE